MRRIHGLGISAALLAIASMALVACGGDTEKEAVKHRDAIPILTLKLKNTGTKPAAATASTGGQTGPAAPGQTVTAAGTPSAKSVAVTVTFEGQPNLTGTGTYPTYPSQVFVQCGETGGTATVTFPPEAGRATETFPVH